MKYKLRRVKKRFTCLGLVFTSGHLSMTFINSYIRIMEVWVIMTSMNTTFPFESDLDDDDSFLYDVVDLGLDEVE